MITVTALALTLTLTGVPADGMTALERRAADMTGIAPSLYRGEWYNEKHEGTRRCIIDRESKGDYRAKNRSSSASGAYQFLDRQWRDGLVWMMLEEEPKGSPKREEIKQLRDVPIRKWNRYYQDRAFWTAYRDGHGAHHWHYPPKPCPPGKAER
jgi:hypothetical protein